MSTRLMEPRWFSAISVTSPSAYGRRSAEDIGNASPVGLRRRCPRHLPGHSGRSFPGCESCPGGHAGLPLSGGGSELSVAQDVFSEPEEGLRLLHKWQLTAEIEEQVQWKRRDQRLITDG